MGKKGINDINTDETYEGKLNSTLQVTKEDIATVFQGLQKIAHTLKIPFHLLKLIRIISQKGDQKLADAKSFSQRTEKTIPKNFLHTIEANMLKTIYVILLSMGITYGGWKIAPEKFNAMFANDNIENIEKDTDKINMTQLHTYINELGEENNAYHITQSIDLHTDYPAVATKRYSAEGGWLTRMYFGLDEYGEETSFPDTLDVNFATQMEILWKNKLARKWFNNSKEISSNKFQNRRDDLQKGNVNGKKVSRSYPMEYYFVHKVKPYIDGNIQATSLTMQDFMTKTGLCMIDIQRHINRDQLANKKGLDSTRLDLLQKISCSFTAQDITSYCLTELMESQTEGSLNIQLLEILLKHAGEEFIEMIPALGDNKTSFGAYQFTEYALYDTPDQKRGASVINNCISDGHKIPGSMIDLSISDQYKAAYLFAINNIADLIKKCNDTEFRKLSKNRENNKSGLLQFIAAAHHAPNGNSGAISTGLRRIDNDMEKDFVISTTGTGTGKRIKAYATKTKNNAAAVQDYTTKNHPDINNQINDIATDLSKIPFESLVQHKEGN